MKKILIMAGGTGGHVFPGLALASYLQKQQVKVHWLGTQAGIEKSLVPAVNIPLHCIKVSGLRGKGIKPWLLAPFKLLVAVWQASRFIKEIKPDVVIGMGGFASGPGGLASWLMGCPLVIHEQNAKPGFTNKVLAPLAYKVLQGFPETFKPSGKAVVVGNPVRQEMETLPPPEQRFNEKRLSFRLLILGGSLGAQALNELLPEALALLGTKDRPDVFHQTGIKHLETVRAAYASRKIEAKIEPFISKIHEAYAWADMVICRAGALTVAELCAVGVGAVFVPFPYAVDDHQTANAVFMVSAHAALCLQQQTVTPAQLAEIINRFSQMPEKRLAMARAAFSLRKANVAAHIFTILTEAANHKNQSSLKEDTQ